MLVVMMIFDHKIEYKGGIELNGHRGHWILYCRNTTHFRARNTTHFCARRNITIHILSETLYTSVAVAH